VELFPAVARFLRKKLKRLGQTCGDWKKHKPGKTFCPSTSKYSNFPATAFRLALSTSIQVWKSLLRKSTAGVTNTRPVCDPQKNFVRPAKHSGKTSSCYFRLFVSV